MRTVSFLLLVLGLAACGANTTQRKIYSYNFQPVASDGSICPTGDQAFTTLKGECQALQDESLNNGCALAERQQTFAVKCPGQTFKSFDLMKSVTPSAVPTIATKSSSSNTPSDESAKN